MMEYSDCAVGQSQSHASETKHGARRSGYQIDHAGHQLVVKALEGFAQAQGEEGLERLAVEEVGVWINADGKGTQFLQPDRIGDGQVVASAYYIAGSEDGAILALSVLFAYPPPQVFRMDKFEGLLHWRSFDLAAIDPVTVSLQNCRSLAHVGGEKARIARLVETSEWLPGLGGDEHIFGMAVGAATVAEFRLEDIQQRGLPPIRIAGFLQGKATGNRLSDK